MHFLIDTAIVLPLIYFIIISLRFRMAAFVLLGIAGVGLYLIKKTTTRELKNISNSL